MTAADPPSLQPTLASRLGNQPYLLLSLMALFWAGNIVLGRYVAGHVPPFALTFVRWAGTFLVVLPFAWPHLRRDWPTMRLSLPLLVMLSATGFAVNNALSYWGLQHTQALNALLIQSSGPLFVALWSLILFGVRLSWAQATGIIDLAGRRDGHHFTRQHRNAGSNRIQRRRHHVRGSVVRVRALFSADAAPASDQSVVADCVHHRLRRRHVAASWSAGKFPPATHCISML